MLSYNNAFFPDVFTLRLQKQPVTQFLVEKDYACCVLGPRMHPCIIFYFCRCDFFLAFQYKNHLILLMRDRKTSSGHCFLL